MIKTFKTAAAFAMAATLTATFSCTSNEDLADSPALADQTLSLDGNCDFYTIANTENADWQIVECPAWITPVAMQGSASDEIKIYVEENNRPEAVRQGDIKLQFSNGSTRAVDTHQSNTRAESKKNAIYQRSYATGWSFDIRSYSDSRGIREQIFNIQKMLSDNPTIYAFKTEGAEAKVTDLYYGEDATKLQNDINGKLSITGKYNSFTGELSGNFGKSTLNDSRRIFSWVRTRVGKISAFLRQTDPDDLQEAGWFTMDFAQTRDTLIEAQKRGYDLKPYIKKLIGNYGTHVVLSATLGGSYDYFYSSVVDKNTDVLDIKGAINFGFEQKFNIQGEGKYKDSFEKMNSEAVEKFYVKGGDAIALARSVELQSKDDAVGAWEASLDDSSKYELMEYQLTPIAAFFPEEVSEAISNYVDELYYLEMPLTRAPWNE